MKSKTKVPNTKRKVLVSAISDNKGSDFKIFLDEGFDKTKILNKQNENIPDKLKLKNKWNWNTLKLTFKTYEHIYKWIVIVDKKCKKSIEESYDKTGISDGNREYVMSYLTTFVNSIPVRDIAIEIIMVDQVNDFEKLFKEIKPDLELKLNPYSSHKIIFNITPGTALVSSAITLLSIKGQRGLCYSMQLEGEEDKLLDFEADVFDISDVWESIMMTNEEEKKH